MNIVFFVIVLAAFLTTAWREFIWVPADGVASPMKALSAAMVDSATGSVELALGLIGAVSYTHLTLPTN